MKVCYYCGKEFNNSDVTYSKEHIIMNAMGGKLKSNDILCTQCNISLSELIDTPFTKMMAPIYFNLPLNKDRDNEPVEIRGKHSAFNVEVVTKGDTVAPLKPVFKDNTIYAANEKIVKQYSNKLLNDGEITYGQEVNYCLNIPGAIENYFNIDNGVFRRGFLKIAAGYASYCGIDRSLLNMAIAGTKAFVKKPVVLTYIPYFHSDIEYESNCNYPVHILKLFTTRKSKELYCYIELFSTFKYLVQLATDFPCEDIEEYYIYDIQKQEELSMDEYTKQYAHKVTKDTFLYRLDSINEYIEFLFKTSYLIKSFTYKRFYRLQDYSNMIRSGDKSM